MTGDANLGSLVAKLGIDTATLRNTIGEAKQHFTKLKLDTDQAASGIGGAFQKAGGIAAASIAAIGIGAAAFAVKSAHAFEDVGREVIKLQRYTGGTAEEMSKLRFAAQQSGVDTDKLTRSMGLLSKNLQSGKGDFDKFGIATVDANGKALPLNAVLLNVAERFKSMPNGAEKTAEAIKLFGRAGADLLPMLNKGRDGLEALEKQAAKYGQVLTEKNIVAVKASVAAHREQAAAWQGLQLQIGSQVLPALTSLTKSFTEGLLVVMPAITRIIGDTVVPVFSGLAAVVGGLTGVLSEHTGAAKVLAVVVGGPVVAALTAWAVAQARVMGLSVVSFITEAAAAAVDLAGALNLVTVSSESTAIGFTKMNAATGVAFVGIGLIIAKIIGDNQKMQASARETAAAVTKGAESPQAAIDQLREKQAAYHKEMGGGVNVMGVHLRLTEEHAKKAAEAAAGYKATTDELRKLTDATKGTDDEAGKLEESFTKQGLAVQGLGGATALTKDQIEELAASMKIDLSKATDEQKAQIEEMARRLGYTSVATLKLADDQKVLGDWTADVTKKTAAFSDSLDQLMGKKMDSAAADRAMTSAQEALQNVEKDNADKLAAANRNVESTVRSLTSATEARTAAQETLDAILHPTARTKEEAALGESDAKIAADRAKIAVRSAQDRLDKLRADPKSTPDEIRSAELDLADARNNVVHATERLADAQAKVNALTPQGIKDSKDYKTATANLASANQGVADAQSAVTTAQAAAAQIANDVVGRQNALATATENVAKAFEAQAKAVFAATQDAVKANAILGGGAQYLRDTLGAMGQNKGQINDALQATGLGGFDPSKIRVGANAVGGIITRPMLSMLGEGGKPEVVLPLTDPRRMRELIGQAGIGSLFGGGYTPGTGQSTEQHNHVHLEAPVDAGIARQVEYAGRVLGWQLDPSGA